MDIPPAAELEKFIDRIIEKLVTYGIVAKPIPRRQSDEAREQALAIGRDFAEVFALIQAQKKSAIKLALSASRARCKNTQEFAPGA